MGDQKENRLKRNRPYCGAGFQFAVEVVSESGSRLSIDRRETGFLSKDFIGQTLVIRSTIALGCILKNGFSETWGLS
jgi:hypothetical protein